MSRREGQISPVIESREDPTEVSLGVSATDERYVNRELSWLSFNERVLQEAESSSVPLLERIKFLAIFSSNLDEFFRVRVASLRSLLRLRRKKRKKKGLDPTKLLSEIHAVALAQQERFGRVFRDDILPGLQDVGVHLIGEGEADAEDRAVMEGYFVEHVAEHLEPVILGQEDTPLTLWQNSNSGPVSEWALLALSSELSKSPAHPCPGSCRSLAPVRAPISFSWTTSFAQTFTGSFQNVWLRAPTR